jgi:hypothetical protein
MKLRINDFRYPNGISVKATDIDYMDFDLKTLNDQTYFALHIHTTSISASSTPVKKTELFLSAEQRMTRVRQIHDQIQIATDLEKQVEQGIA